MGRKVLVLVICFLGIVVSAGHCLTIQKIDLGENQIFYVDYRSNFQAYVYVGEIKSVASLVFGNAEIYLEKYGESYLINSIDFYTGSAVLVSDEFRNTVMLFLGTQFGEQNNSSAAEQLVENFSRLMVIWPKNYFVKFDPSQLTVVSQLRNSLNGESVGGLDSVGNDQWLSICDDLGKVYEGRYYDLDDSGNWVEKSYRHLVGGSECFGRCGWGCWDAPGKDVYSADCFNHDACVTMRGRTDEVCNEMFKWCIDDVLNAPDCKGAAPGKVYISPEQGDWATSPRIIKAGSMGASRIYYNMSVTYDGSIPQLPVYPTVEKNDGWIEGDLGQLELYAYPGQIKQFWIRFIGYSQDNQKYGPATISGIYKITPPIRPKCGSVSGVVHKYSVDGEVLKDAQIQCDQQASLTGKDGSFQFENLSQGFHWITISSQGCLKSYRTHFFVMAGDAYDIGDLYLEKSQDLLAMQSPLVGKIGTVFYQWGSGFTPFSWAEMYVTDSSGAAQFAGYLEVDCMGNFYTSYVVPKGKPQGTYCWWVVDQGMDGCESNTVCYKITSSGWIEVNP